VPVHHGEIYIFSTPRKYLATGDVYHTGGKRYIVLTPSCDLVFRNEGEPKAISMLVALIKDLKPYMESNKECRKILSDINIVPTDEASREQKERAVESLEEMMRHSFMNPIFRRFFLPPFGPFKGGVVDFSKLLVVPYSRAEGERIKTQSWEVALDRDVVGEMSTRFGKYISRIGQPSYMREPLLREFSSL
jgi:hypothetical protein